MKSGRHKLAVRQYAAAVVFFLLAHRAAAAGTEKIYIWDAVAGMENCVKDSILYVYPAENAHGNTAAVIICPGGSYHHLGMGTEGRRTAEWFSRAGITAFILRYRVSVDWYHHPAMIEDIQRSIQIVRQNAAARNIDAEKIGCIGFSAGGHLVAMAGACPEGNVLVRLGLEETNVRPNYVISVYPVISMQDDIAHKRSRRSLLGSRGTEELRDLLSLELHVPRDMPPVFLLACKDDPIVDYRNSVRYDEALSASGVPHTFALYETGGHAFGMKNGTFMRKTNWDAVLEKWLEEIGMLH
ncbi:MAG: alpha/beta hydrolase [Bacteroides sp.]|nr:alpha/beta hydrolase [Prevotella sp.]MCM1408415.1 alpha/beta hydrolase [Treponema brennaborense]MCM1469423.1 alpha/beta hydrolase [Bacteroides sp.]